MSWDKPMLSLAGPGKPVLIWKPNGPHWTRIGLWAGDIIMIGPVLWPPETFKQCACAKPQLRVI